MKGAVPHLGVVPQDCHPRVQDAFSAQDGLPRCIKHAYSSPEAKRVRRGPHPTETGCTSHGAGSQPTL
jgi:hypothetical protein